MGKIYSELSRIQQELKAPKNLYNSFGKYSYRNAEGILEAVKPMLNGLAMIINDEPVLIGDRFYIKATVTLTDGEESVSAVAYAREDKEKKGMDGCQITGACSSYARKYALNALLMIDDSKDSDDDSLSPKNPANDDKQEKKQEKHTENKDFKNQIDSKSDVKVTITDKVPPIEPMNPVKKYIINQINFMGQMFGIADKDKMFEKFEEMRKTLVKAGIIEDVKSDKQTLKQAEAMIDAMYANFKPNGEFAPKGMRAS